MHRRPPSPTPSTPRASGCRPGPGGDARPAEQNQRGGRACRRLRRPPAYDDLQPPYYQRLPRLRLTKAKDLHAYKVDIAAIAPDLSNVPDRVKRMAKVAVERYKVEMRQVNLRDIAGELEHIKKIYRTAWEKNWGAIPMTDAEMEHLADSGENSRPTAPVPGLYRRPTRGGVPGPARPEPGGHPHGRATLPFGWLQFLWYRRKINGLRVMIMGVLEEHRLKGIDALYFRGHPAIQGDGHRGGRCPILEDNFKVRRGMR